MNFLLFLVALPIIWIAYNLYYDNYIFPKELVRLRSYIKDERISDVLSTIKKMSEGQKNNPEVLFCLATVQTYQKQWYLALYNLEKILTLRSFLGEINEIKVRSQKLEIYKNLNKMRAAMKECETILKLDPDNEEANFEMGQRLYTMKNFTKAKEFLEKIASESNNTKIHEMLFDIYMIEEKYDNALSSITMVIQNEKQPPCRILAKEARVLYYLNRYQEVIDIIEKFDSTYNQSLELKLIRAICYYELGDFGNAHNIFMPLLKTYIDDYSDLILKARYVYSKLLIDEKFLKEALSQMKFIKSYNRNYRDNALRHKLYETIFTNDFLRDFYNNYPDDVKVKEIIFQIFNQNNKYKIVGSRHNLPVWQIVQLRERNVRRNHHVLFSLQQEPLTMIHTEQVVEDHSSVVGYKNELTVLSLFRLAVQEENHLNQVYDKCHFIYEQEFLEHLQYMKKEEKGFLDRISTRANIPSNPQVYSNFG